MSKDVMVDLEGRRDWEGSVGGLCETPPCVFRQCLVLLYMADGAVSAKL